MGVLGLLCSGELACAMDKNAFWFFQSLSQKPRGGMLILQTICVCGGGEVMALQLRI